MEKRFERAITLLQQAGYGDIAARLESELAAMRADTYKIAVVGEFKTGKSTLINRIFLKEEVLFTDILEATAIPTEISYCPERRLEIVPYAKDAPGSRGPAVIAPVADSEAIRACTSADTPEERARLARETERVRLGWPAPNLEGLTLFDTPGINSINAAVIATTWRILPESDLVLFVTSARQLSHAETAFLSGRVLAEGITRAMIVVTCDPDAGELSAADRDRLRKGIQNQLAHIGCGAMPVTLVNIRDGFAPDRTAEGGFSYRITQPDSPRKRQAGRQAVNDIIGDLLGETPSPLPAEPARKPPAADGFGALEETLIRFLRENVRPGREEKAGRVLAAQIQLARVRCEAALSMMDKNDAERRQVLADLRAREAEMRLKYDRLTAEFQDALRAIQGRFAGDADAGMAKIAHDYVAGFEACEGIGELQARLKNAQTLLKRDMEQMLFAAARQAETETRALVAQYGIRSRILLNPWQSEVSRMLNIEAGILSRIPPFAILAADIMLFVRFGPFGPLADILIRLVAHYIPLLNRALPASVAASVLRRKIRVALTARFETLRPELSAQAEAAFGEMRDALITQWHVYAEAQLTAVRTSVADSVGQPVDREEQIRLSRLRAELTDLAHGIHQ
ncbi:hypothetical protein DENIS_4657 [Desulfonema ishimotonii]|uniref:Dynamin N-terminal domain-containing protein n=1 Tax=Desulfonema ishimotonii TaxID=45657 RepID=A0A401G335_9BACT|nr:dynamin family protein [Desulfonema ishimotonii]GBC63659.1 hypothetical protein DENIS_4657 [Desulfonema ishimotonii]